MRAMFAYLAPAGILLVALLADALLGDPPALYRVVPHPVVLIGKAIAAFDRKWNRPERSAAARKALGVLMLVVLVGAALAIGAAFHAAVLRVPFGWIAEAAAVYVFVAQKSLYDHVRAVADGLRDGGLAGGRAAVSRIVGRDPEHLDEAGVCRAAIESCAENYSDGIAAPVFWYAVLGLPGLLAYKVTNTLDSMVGYKSPPYLHFGWASARFDDVMNWIPARLSGLFLIAAAWLQPWADARAAWRIMVRDARVHRSPNSGWPETAMAGALGLKLQGPRVYPDEVVDDPWIGDGTPDADAGHIRKALALYLWACGMSGLAAVVVTALVA